MNALQRTRARLVSLTRRSRSGRRTKTGADRTATKVARTLRSFGMPRSLVATLTADLRAELTAAAETGVGPEPIVGKDADRFAARLAEAHGYQPVPLRLFGLTAAAALPMSFIAFIVYVVIAGGGPNLGLPYMTVAVERNESNRAFLDGINEGWFIAATYLTAGAFGFALTLGGAAAYLALRGDRCIARTVRNLVVALPAGVVAGVAAAMLVGRSTDYSDDANVIAVECAVVAVAVVVAIRVGRGLARGRAGGGDEVVLELAR